MKIGRVTQHWNRNCLAVGLSQGFIEPLEATALLFIQHTAASLRRVPGAAAIWARRAHERFNQRVNEHFEGTRDYIVTHYKTNTRHGYRVLARQRREPQPVGRPEEALLCRGWRARASRRACASR